jgi:hypothetical protein
MGTIWREVGPDRLKYISCGPYGCWGINRNNNVYFKTGVSASDALGKKWLKIDDIEQLTQIEAGPGGIAVGLRPDATVVIRTGVTRDLPQGKAWEKLDTSNIPVKHVTVSLDKIYILLAILVMSMKVFWKNQRMRIRRMGLKEQVSESKGAKYFSLFPT